MSTDTGRRLVRAVALAAFAGAGVLPVVAADVVFRPLLSFGLGHDGNIDVIGPGRGDDVAELALDLAVDRTSQRDKLFFVYRPSYRMYRKSSELDYFGNAVVFSYAHQSSKQTETHVSFDATRSDTQGIQSYSSDRALTFVPRTTTYRFAGEVGGTVGFARRNLFDWDVRLQSDRYKDTATTTFDNNAAASALGGWRFEMTERASIGLANRVEWFVYDQSAASPVPSIFTDSLSLVGANRLGRTTEIGYGAGAAYSSSAGSTQTNPIFSFTVSSKRSERSTLSAGAKQTVGTGTGIGGGSLDRGAWIGYARAAEKRGLAATVYASYWFRRSLELGQQSPGEIRTGDVTGTLGWSFNRFINLAGAYTFVDQHSPAGTASASASASDTNYSSYGVYLRWAIRGR